MKTKLFLLAVIAAASVLSGSTSFGQAVDSLDATHNRAIAASPRAKEVFPWLARGAATAESPAKLGSSKTTLPPIAQNRAIAASPRALEQFPELGRPARPLKAADRTITAGVIKNRAIAASPRALEQFPWLARDKYTVSEKPFEIAPLK